MLINTKAHLKNHLATTTLLTSSILLAACGGSSSSGSDTSNQTETVTLSGTAAIGAAITNASVSARCEDGSGFIGSVMTDSNGRFEGNVEEGALPCALSVRDSDGTAYHSLATAAGTTNITPLTDLAIALAGEDPAQWFEEGELATVAEVIEQRGQELLNTLDNLGYTLPENLDPFQGSFAIGDSHDRVLDQLGEALNNSNVLQGYQQLVLLLKDGNLNQLPALPEQAEDPAPNPQPSPGDDNDPAVENYSACYNPELYRTGAVEVGVYNVDPSAQGIAPFVETNTLRVLGETTFNGQSVNVREFHQEIPQGSSTMYFYFTLDAETGIYSDYGSSITIAGEELQFTNEPSLEKVFDIGLNETHRDSYTTTGNGTSAEALYENTFLGIETVEVPAGTIEACKIRTRMLEDGVEVADDIQWVGVGTGVLIKAVSPGDTGETNPMLVVELQSSTLNGQSLY